MPASGDWTKRLLRNVSALSKSVAVKQLLVDTGSEFTWIPRKELEQIGIAVRKIDVPFVMANGATITHDVGYAVLKLNGFETVDEVVFAQSDDIKLLGSRTLEGFGATVDARKKRLVAAGPQLAAPVGQLTGARAALAPVARDK